MRKVASVLSICIIAGLLIVYVPNIIAGAGKIGDTVNAMKTADLPFGKALYAAFLYGTFQLANVAVFVQHAKSFEKPQDAGKSMAVGAVLNALLMIMVVLGIMTVYQNPEMIQQSVPTLFMVQQGVDSKFMTPLISVLIILGAVSTAVNMVAAMVKRIHAGLAERSSRTETAGKISRTQILAALVCCIADFLIAQFGLLTLIQKAYSILAYLAIPVILVPYVVHMAVTRFDTKKIEKNNKKFVTKIYTAEREICFWRMEVFRRQQKKEDSCRADVSHKEMTCVCLFSVRLVEYVSVTKQKTGTLLWDSIVPSKYGILQKGSKSGY